MTDWFRPGFKAGGTITSSYNLSMLLKDDCLIYIFTSDRDIGDHMHYPSITTDEWCDFCPNVRIYYATPEEKTWNNILKQIRQLSPDGIYLNSMYSRYFTIYPLLQKRIGLIRSPVFLSPSGMLKENALQRKAFKKIVYLKIFRLLKIQDAFTFHATDASESIGIRKIFGKAAAIKQVYLAPPAVEESIVFPLKKKGHVKIVFTGRIHPIKNLHFFLECLLKIRHVVEFIIIGPIEDRSYYEQCRQLKERMPENITVTFLGAMPPEKIKCHLLTSHFLVLPSLGENFGYAIVEALCAGRPVMISDRTPWRNMEAQHAGWDLSLFDPDAYIMAIKRAADMEQEEYNEWVTAAWNFARHSLSGSACQKEYITMFDLL
jgi:glycosyltransferase involved in cell wall biosynthesis